MQTKHLFEALTQLREANNKATKEAGAINGSNRDERAQLMEIKNHLFNSLIDIEKAITAARGYRL